jgi:hypothetical protein
MAARRFSAVNFLQRWIAALALVFATFNPTGYSFAHWASGPTEESLPFKVILGIVLFILYIIFLRATWRSIGPIGVGLVVVFFGAIVWAMFYYEVLAFEQTTALTYIGLIVLATVLAVGLSWSHIRRRISGQIDTDDVDE